MAKTLEDYLQENPNMKFSQADMDLGRNNFGALEQIIQARKDWGQATTADAKKAANNKANTVRQYYGGYSGGGDGMAGQYSPTYVKPGKGAQEDNIQALYEQYNSAYKNAAPTWTPKYEKEIGNILGELKNKEPFTYDMNEDKLYQQYRDQYIREGQRAMKDTAAQTAALTGGYGSTYGSIAAQQGYDNYLSGLNDRVPQLEQAAYGKYADEIRNMYNRMGALQSEESRLYGKYLDAMGQHNTDRNFSFNGMQAAMGQNNYENEFDRGIFESDRAYGLDKDSVGNALKQQQIENALSIGDYRGLKDMGYDTAYLDFMKQASMRKATESGTKKSRNNDEEYIEDSEGGEYEETTSKKNTNGYLYLVMNYKLKGNTVGFEETVGDLINKGAVTKEDYMKFKNDIGI